jgi:hypothetical protein
MFGQWCPVPVPPCAGAPGELGVEGAVVDGLELAAGGDGLGLAASAGIVKATAEPSAAAPKIGAPMSSSLRLSGMFASCSGWPSVREGSMPTTLAARPQEAVGEPLEFDWKWARRRTCRRGMPHAVWSA